MNEYDDLKDGEEFKDRSVRTSDKLTYRIVLQNKVNHCLNMLGTIGLGRSVKALRTGMYFDIPGLPFRNKIKKKEAELLAIYKSKIIHLLENNTDEWIHPIKKDINNLSFTESYYEALLEYLIDLLATHDALIQSKDFVETGEESPS